MKSYKVYKNYIYRISGGKHPTLFLLDCENQDPMKVKKEIKMPVLPKFAKGEDIIYLQKAEKFLVEE